MSRPSAPFRAMSGMQRLTDIELRRWLCVHHIGADIAARARKNIARFRQHLSDPPIKQVCEESEVISVEPEANHYRFRNSLNTLIIMRIPISIFPPP